MLNNNASPKPDKPPFRCWDAVVGRLAHLVVWIMLMALASIWSYKGLRHLNDIGETVKNHLAAGYRKPSELVPVWFEFNDDLMTGEIFGSFKDSLLLLFIIPLLLAIVGAGFICLPHVSYSLVLIFIGSASILSFAVSYSIVKSVVDGTNTVAVENLRKVISHNYHIVPGSKIVAAMNAIMIIGHCCGVTGTGDFNTSNLEVSVKAGVNPNDALKLPPWLPKDFLIPYANVTYSGRFKIPPACCKDKVFMANDVKERFYNAVYCAETANKTLLNTDGCYKYFFHSFVEPWTNHMLYPFLGVGCLFTVLSGLIPHMPKGDRNNLLDKTHPNVKKFFDAKRRRGTTKT